MIFDEINGKRSLLPEEDSNIYPNTLTYLCLRVMCKERGPFFADVEKMYLFSSLFSSFIQISFPLEKCEKSLTGNEYHVVDMG